MRFAELTNNQVKFIETIEIGEHFIEEEDVKKVTEVLALNGKDGSELTAIRNSIVKHLGDRFDELMGVGLGKEANRMWNNMSGITAVIDNMLWKIGAMV